MALNSAKRGERLISASSDDLFQIYLNFSETKHVFLLAHLALDQYGRI